jgi:YidC/Oxa1 family membrane protein insertase
MMVFGKQMQRIQPELEKLKTKYSDDPQRFQQEQMKLWREHHINPLRMLGCLPMFLQTPIWIALYAMIFLAVELRHEPAFYGVFQQIGGWSFLEDLSRPDRFISFFEETKTVGFGFFQFDYSSLNILPLLWIVINIINMTLNTPAAATEQAKTQQRMMKIMMSLFGVFLYAAPSALTLYMCASTTIGIVDAMIVRRHVKHLEDSGKLDPEHPESIFKKKDKGPKKPPKPGSFKWKMQRRLELAKEAMEAQQAAAAKGQNQPGGGAGSNRAIRRASQRKKR